LSEEWNVVGKAQDHLLTAGENFLRGRSELREFQVALNNLSNKTTGFLSILTDKYLFISGDPPFDCGFENSLRLLKRPAKSRQ
jgi:hypothetical protein